MPIAENISLTGNRVNSGSKVPLLPNLCCCDEPLYDTYTGNLVKFVDGEPMVVGYGQPSPPVVPDAWPDEASFLQYETARCMDPLADHRGCSTWINPDG